MLYSSITDFYQALPKTVRLLGLDIGTKKIGYAISDQRLMVATPLGVSKNTKFTDTVTFFRDLADKEQIGGIVMGFPLHMDGSHSPGCDRIISLANAWIKLWDVPIYLQDERLSTASANRSLQELELSRKHRHTMDDQIAASIILQSTLDAIRSQCGF